MSHLSKALLAASVAALGCQQTKLVAQQREDEQTDTFNQTPRAQSDILWIVDNSGSMAREQDQLADSFPKFFAFLQDGGLDYRIGVTTTDVITPGNAPGTDGTLFGSPSVIVGNSTDARVPNTPNPTAAFAVNIHVGTQGSARDEALEAAATAIQKLQASAGAAEDAGQPVLFLRPTAALFLVFVGDGIDYSPPYDLYGVQYYWREYLQAKGIGNNGLVQVAAIAGIPPLGCYPQICTDGVATGLDTDAGLTPFGERYYELVELANGLFGSICDCNFDVTLENLGLEVLALPHKFRLSKPSDPTSIIVTVNYPCSTPDPENNLICIPKGLQCLPGPQGNLLCPNCSGGFTTDCGAACATLGVACTVPQVVPDGGSTDGWTYNPGDNSITFSASTLPPPGTQITITYTIAGVSG